MAGCSAMSAPAIASCMKANRVCASCAVCHDDQIMLTSYGRSSGFCIDPIEKKPLNHFLPGTPVLSFGTAGCNLACKFCQNWDMSKSREMDTLADEARR
jgi:pyruvate formate lyase activating enzyme